ncbi:MFS general substrate transporter [Trametes coccinea BRFM310]|uniref:MFS general substrate transporter n=1 Tax=Trametes coccinea (strain BRFM310) TaxID=1353009 RepID=A0A1Y2IA01_TRAC3|nr:MFS general substrate transporter [Trametes coccinea BRFM310]
MRVQDCLFVLSVCGVTILNIFVNGALIIALPTIGKALDFSEADLQWPLNVYALSYGSLLLLCGRIADVVGAKRMFLFGTGFFTIWSIATGVAPNKVSLIVFVALTGVGAAANTPTGISIFANHFESGPTKNRAIAALGAGQAVGYIVGLVGGGFLCQSEKLWPVIFYIQGGLAAVFFVLGVITIPSDVHHKRYTKGIDWVGAVLSVGGVGLLTFVLSESTTVSRGWKTPWVPALLVVSLLILAAFVLWEWYRERHDLSVIMPVSLWTKPGTKMAPTIAVVFLAWASYNCMSYFANLFFQQVRGDDPAQTSFETIPFAIMAFLANVIAGALLGILRGDVLIGLGLLGTMAAPLILALIDERASYWKMAFWMFNVSWTDVAYTVGNLQISISFPPSSQGLAGGIFNVATRLGTSLGLALTSSVSAAVSARYNARHPELARDAVPVVMAGVRAGAWVTFGLAAAAFAVCVVCLRGIGVIGLKMHEDAESESSDAGLGGAGDVEGIAELGAASDKTGTLAEVLPTASLEKV